MPLLKNAFAPTSINRIRLEFKVLKMAINDISEFVLIESDWNLKSKDGRNNWTNSMSINRIRLEFKV